MQLRPRVGKINGLFGANSKKGMKTPKGVEARKARQRSKRSFEGFKEAQSSRPKPLDTKIDYRTSKMA